MGIDQQSGSLIATAVRHGRGSRLEVLIACGLSLLLAGCQRAQAPANPAAAEPIEISAKITAKSPVESLAAASQSTQKSSGGFLLTDVTRQLGFKDPQERWPDGTYLTPEITPGGVALLDYDQDGRLDIFQVCHCPPGSFTKPAPSRLFHQEPDGRFKEVPRAGGLTNTGFGHGVAVGDVDNDGYPDVYVTNYGRNKFFLNRGDGTFIDATESAGLADKEDHWNSSAGFLDYDRDGYLDLYVVRFAKFDPNRKCFLAHGEVDYCGPHMFDGELHKLYHNNGDGTFTDVTARAGINQRARGWGLVCADLTGDGWPDIYVANDGEPALLWVNQRDGTFKDEAVLRGCAFNAAGRTEAGMGLAVGDVDGDGQLDLFKTHIASETNTLYLANKRGFIDSTAAAGMGVVDRPYTGWGTAFFDLDHDGDLDVAVVNARVSRGPIRRGAALGPFWNQFAEPKLLFLNDGKGHFTDVSSKTGGFGSTPETSHGMALGDIDGDGDIDIVVNNLDNTLRVYRNDAPKGGNHWLIVRAMTGKRDAYGALLTAEAGGKKFVRLAHPTYSFLSSNDPRAHFGLGPANKVDSLLIAWPSGRQERFEVPGVDRVLTVHEGEGQAVPAER